MWKQTTLIAFLMYYEVHEHYVSITNTCCLAFEVYFACDLAWTYALHKET